MFAGTRCGSFALAAEALRELAEVPVPVKQVERRTQQIGTERCAERDAAVAAYESLPLVERKQAPPDVVPPPIAVVQMDGGRLQIRNPTSPEQPKGSAVATPVPPKKKKKGEHWREDKVGLLASMASVSDTDDPCPQIPTHYIDPERIPRLAQEIKSKSKAAGREPAGDAVAPVDPQPVPEATGRYEPPELVVRSVVSTKQGVEVFGGLLAAAAWARGFYGSKRRVFLGDGSNANWGVWERHFSSFTPVVDFIHALAYVYGAATAGGPFGEGWSRYVQWIEALWRGDVATVVSGLESRQQVLGMPEATDGETHPRVCVAEARCYFENQRGRMKYAEYRRAGLPITTSHVESTIKQMNHRVKGSEKFWSEPGAEAILQLRADLLSETAPLDDFWNRRQANITGERRHRLAG
ncbi:hypothetical protein R5W24_006563 [Gemmata sp. JC717]|uniref:hypothetical protein n=1 Tax=Gemmata algarum TaxID=2975278 RepID=UPI0021BAA04D|nr:hypothetical protein [Gemmata algarum]MDY3557373.1 hypothetical protein [Gemmata algarum]